MRGIIVFNAYNFSIRPTRGWNRPGLRPGGKAHSVFDGACCILNLYKHSRPGGSTASRWASEINYFIYTVLCRWSIWQRAANSSMGWVQGEGNSYCADVCQWSRPLGTSNRLSVSCAKYPNYYCSADCRPRINRDSPWKGKFFFRCRNWIANCIPRLGQKGPTRGSSGLAKAAAKIS